MKIIVDKVNAFVHLKGDTFLCVGPKKEVLKADPITLSKMVMTALAMTEYNDIQSSKVVH